jgi:hypothetical protein
MLTELIFHFYLYLESEHPTCIKIRINKTLISPAILQEAEVWTLSRDISVHLREFERKIFRRINGAAINITESDAIYKLQTLYEDMDIVTLIKVRRLNRIGHTTQVDDIKKAKLSFNTQPEGARRWECVWADIKKGKIMNWSTTSRHKNERKKANEEAKLHLKTVGQLRRRRNHYVLYM